MDVRIKYLDCASVREETLVALKGRDINIIESEDPEYVIYSVGGGEHLKYNCPRIFITGENTQPDFNVCDYAIAFGYMTFDDRYKRIPLYRFYLEDYDRAIHKHEIVLSDEMISKRKFCNFVYSNGTTAQKDRDEFYYNLCKYKSVDSGGRHLNNVGGPVESKFDFQKKYKFSIAFENACTPGYTTEKILQAFAAGTIPIYYGNPRIAEDFNNKAFINCHEYNSFEEVIEKIAEIDNDDSLFRKYISEPIFSDNLYDEPLKEYGDFLEYIFRQGPEKAKRRCDYNIASVYQNEMKKYWFLKELRDNRTIKNRIINKIVNNKRKSIGM